MHMYVSTIMCILVSIHLYAAPAIIVGTSMVRTPWQLFAPYLYSMSMYVCRWAINSH